MACTARDRAAFTVRTAAGRFSKVRTSTHLHALSVRSHALCVLARLYPNRTVIVRRPPSSWMPMFIDQWGDDWFDNAATVLFTF